MGVCGSKDVQSRDQKSAYARQFSSFTEEDQVRLQTSKLLLYIDCYNREVEKVNQNIVICGQRALDYKKSDQKNLAMFYINKRKNLEILVDKYTQKSIILSNRKHKIEELEDQKEFAKILKDTNDILENHLNQNVINEIKRNNEIDSIIQQQNAMIGPAEYSDDVIEEYENMDLLEKPADVRRSLIPSITQSRRDLDRENYLINV